MKEGICLPSCPHMEKEGLNCYRRIEESNEEAIERLCRWLGWDPEILFEAVMEDPQYYDLFVLDINEHLDVFLDKLRGLDLKEEKYRNWIEPMTEKIVKRLEKLYD
jgi:hypothetical protein